MVCDLRKWFDVRILHSALSQSKGFMFERPAKKALVFVFKKPKRVVFHMWFVFGPIDLIELDATKRVLFVKEQFRPWQVYCLRFASTYVVEVPAGSARKLGIAKGKTLKW
ncbi:DUF192 domain-containing protein [Candidatus Woesearchaeota archaeon]|nr:MAG: DUF192 domain-containing protein [Candidatus Woesearchaeota archaeon]